MNREQLLQKLKDGPVRIEFIKANGDPRIMTATLSDNFIPYQQSYVEKTPKIEPAASQPVWDIDVGAWRSFSWKNIRAVENVDIPNGIK